MMIRFTAAILLLICTHASSHAQGKAERFFKMRKYYLFSPGIWAPAGFKVAIVPDTSRFGIYLSARANFHAFKRSGEYYFENGYINDPHHKWSYQHEKVYGRMEANAGMTFRISCFGNNSLHAYAGAGAANTKYMYKFLKAGTLGGVTESEWVTNNDISGYYFNTEAGIVFSLKDQLRFQLGLSSLMKKSERMIVFGIGF